MAAVAGVLPFGAAADTWAGTPWEAMFAHLHTEELESRAKIEALIRLLGYKVSVIRKIAFGVVSAAGRFNPLNPARRSGGQMTQAELDSLVSAIRAQQTLWETLTVLADIDDRLDKSDCLQMIERCQDQRARVCDMSRATVKERFTTPTRQ